MTQNNIRDQFLNFFKAKRHHIVASAPVVAQGDASLLFTNAGMNQFKDLFLGIKKINHPRIADTQKCIRVSGKHNDLEEVGVDTFHHTFFEMLGNWSFNDYYKKEAISWAWELLTEVWKLPKEKLYATIYREDNESEYLWKEHTDINPNQILRCDDKDNFWEMGETGPCGPCSEIHYDKGKDYCNCKRRGDGCRVNDCQRYMEIWNLVFIQYNRKPGGILEELSAKHVDTGMGFERIVSVLQGKDSNYDTDIFSPIIDAVSKLSGKIYYAEDVLRHEPEAKAATSQSQIAMRVIADHIRSTSFSIADGVTPSNEGRGYVIRRILRRASLYGRNLGLTEPFLYSLVEVLAEQMGTIFPEIIEKKDYVQKIILSEEKSFNQTLDKGLKRLEEVFKSRNVLKQLESNKIIDGKMAFELHDTYGFPYDLTALIAKERGFEVDKTAFLAEMEEQRKRSKKIALNSSEFYITEAVKHLKQKTEYVGETHFESKGNLLLILCGDQQKKNLNQGESGILVFDKTPFYGESGGQVGDTGQISNNSQNPDDTLLFEVEKTRKLEGFHLHEGEVRKGQIKRGESYYLSIDNSLRLETRKNHSATHLLQKALKDELGDHIKQAGSLVTSDKLRFDFNHFKGLTPEELLAVEEAVNQSIFDNHRVSIEEMSMEAATQKGAIAFFEEKYGDRVRVVDMGDYSIELCGGSHVKHTGEIGVFKILSESSISSGIRRIEAVTSLKAYAIYNRDHQLLSSIKNVVQVEDLATLSNKIAALVKENKRLLKENQSLKGAELKKELKELQPEIIKEVSFYASIYEQQDQNLLKEKIDQIKNDSSKSIVFFATKLEDKIIFLCGVTKDLIKTIKAGDLVKVAANLCGGGGGGRPDFAQAGGRDQSRVKEAFLEVKNYIKENI